jgi:hypothetical protein
VEFYRETNGLEASWSWYPKGEEIFGSIGIPPLEAALFGYNETVERSKYEDAFWDVLWFDESYTDESIRELKTHRVFESIEGQPAFITFKPSADATNLIHVYEETITPIRVPFTDYLRLVIEHLGAGRIASIWPRTTGRSGSAPTRSCRRCGT